MALSPLAKPKKQAATMLMTRPRKVRTLGEILVSARPLTIFCSNHPLPLPKALVQVIEFAVSSVLASTLSRLVDSCAICCARPAASVSVGSSPSRLVVDGGELEDFELAVSVGRNHGGHIADLLPSSARPMGEVVEMRPLVTSDSSLVTSL